MSRDALVYTLVGTWLAGTAVPVLWWLRQRRQPDVWAAMPLPTALLDSAGRLVARSGPDSAADLAVDLGVSDGLPARGRTARGRSRDGSPIALSGLPNGALVVALPGDPLRDRRDRLLADLGSRLAHDLNTPLAAVLGHLDLIGHEPITDQARRSVQVCQQEVTRAHQLARDLLALTSLRAGTARRGPEHAGALAEEAASGVLPLADQLGAQLRVEAPSERVLVEVAADDLVRALRNLLTNALHHGLGQRREVRLCVDADPHAVTFRVQDSGPGLSTHDLAEMSEPLVRGDGTRGGRPVGSGLGLAIVQEVVRAHGGELTSARSGPWAEVAFTLPRAK